MQRLPVPEKVGVQRGARVRRNGGKDRVAVLGVALREHHPLLTAGGAAKKVGEARTPPVCGRRERAPGRHRQVRRAVAEILPHLGIADAGAGGVALGSEVGRRCRAAAAKVGAELLRGQPPSPAAVADADEAAVPPLRRRKRHLDANARPRCRFERKLREDRARRRLDRIAVGIHVAGVAGHAGRQLGAACGQRRIGGKVGWGRLEERRGHGAILRPS